MLNAICAKVYQVAYIDGFPMVLVSFKTIWHERNFLMNSLAFLCIDDHHTFVRIRSSITLVPES